MPSHLTRSVFRRLLANEPIVYRGCLRRRHHSSFPWSRTALRTPLIHNGRTAISHQQQRGFLNFNIFSKKTETREPDMDPGVEKMMELAKRQRMNARMPSLAEIALALRQFTEATFEKRQQITDTQAQLVLQSLRYYVSECSHRDAAARLCYKIMSAFLYTNTASSSHVELSRFCYETLGTKSRKWEEVLVVHVKMLCFSGAPEEAHRLVLQAEQPGVDGYVSAAPDEEAELTTEADDRLGDGGHSKRGKFAIMWQALLRAYNAKGDDAEVERTIAAMQARDYLHNIGIPAIMVDYSLRIADLDAAKKWWWRCHDDHLTMKRRPSVILGPGFLLDRILKWCLRHNEIDSGHAMVREVMTRNPPKQVWDAVFVWAAGTKKGVDEINRMISVMENSNEAIRDSSQWRHPDNVTINSLVEFATSQNDPYMAERFIALGRERNIEPDARTYVLQIDYRLSVGDVDGALIAYKALAEQKDSSAEASDTGASATINRLIVALCGTQRHDFDTIMNVTMDLADRKAPFTSETVSTLTLIHLNRDESDDALDLLNTHAFHFSSSERANIRNAIIAYVLDSNTSTARAWQSYNILRTVFDETPREERTELMNSFFNRERVDIAVRVFQHMRQHTRDDTMPTVDTYVSAFMGLAKLRDVESLEVTNNLLKLDYNINVTTYLRNALIIAYTACGKGRKALSFWDDIVTSKEGPSYNSIHVALRACEKSPFGDLRAKDLWSLLRRRNVELDQALWASYVAALAGNGDNELAIGAIEEAEGKGELEVDYFLLASLCDGAVGDIRQAEIETWAKERYPAEWKRVEEVGWEEDIAKTRTFKIDRRVAP